jgi:uncharacterized protein YbjQ (UPF0145 family)
MGSVKDILVVTTSSIEGRKIIKYFKPITSHVVAGTNILSDIFADFSDVFGGRSNSYQKQLASLYKEAIDKIKYSAYEIGANCIVGLKVDIDEISGKGKSMFMITAIGTGVLIEKLNNSDLILENKKTNLVTIEQLILTEQINNIINDVQNNTLKLTEDTFQFVINHKIVEVFPYIIKRMIEKMKEQETNSQADEKFISYFKAYIEALPDDIKNKLIYNSVIEVNNKLALNLIYSFIEDMSLFDFSRIMELLKNNDIAIRVKGIRLSTSNKPFYIQSDIDDLKQLVLFISDNFKPQAEVFLKKQLLSSKEKEFWNCSCGKNNDSYYCQSCQKDIYGFKPEEIKPSEVINILNNKIDMLSSLII